MWTCPKCGREFKRKNQSHYCGKAPGTVVEYINLQPKETQSHLKEITSILENIPDVRERVKWSMPYFEKDAKSISFAASKKHISFYVGEKAIEKFTNELDEFETKKSAIYFPYDRTLPVELIKALANWCLG